jgi:hypothetical protein
MRKWAMEMIYLRIRWPRSDFMREADRFGVGVEQRSLGQSTPNFDTEAVSFIIH